VGEKETVYELKNLDGTLEAFHVRIDRADGSKSFYWRRPDGASGLGGLRTADLPLFGSERIASFDRGKMVVILEGEKATEAAQQALGLQALGTVTGASSTPSAAVLECLRGLDVVLWPDADEAGRKHVERIAKLLLGVARTVKLLEPPAGVPVGWDAADLALSDDLVLDEAMAQARKLIEEAKPPTTTTAKPTPTLACQWIEDLPPEPPVTWLVPGLIPRGHVIALAGPPGTGKSVLVADLVSAIATGGTFLGRKAIQGPVIYFDADRRRGKVLSNVERTRKARGQPIPPRTFAYWGPGMEPDGRVCLEALAERIAAKVEQTGAVLVVVDTWTKASQGAPKHEEDIAVLARALDLITAKGATVLINDHVAKAPTGRVEDVLRTYQEQALRGLLGSTIKSAIVSVAYLAIPAALEGNPRKLWLPTLKTNLTEHPAPIGVSITFGDFPKDEHGNGIGPIVVEVTEAPQPPEPIRKPSKREQGADTVRKVLREAGGFVLGRERLREGAGLSKDLFGDVVRDLEGAGELVRKPEGREVRYTLIVKDPPGTAQGAE
jgi:hypothetical protein